MNVDGWIEEARKCQVLDETVMKTICDTVINLVFEDVQ